MSINLDSLSEAELVDLNHRVVQRIKFIRQARAHHAMLQFRIGELVCFQTQGGEPIEGVIIKYNRKSVTVLTQDGLQWRVAPSLLCKVETPKAPHEPSSATVLKLTPR